MSRKKAKSLPVTTIAGIVTKSPKRVTTDTSKVMASMMIEVQSDKRSNYPMKITGFDEQALNLMLCRKGQEVIVTGRSSYWHGYQLVVNNVLIM